jgi:hypothetical protein
MEFESAKRSLKEQDRRKVIDAISVDENARIKLTTKTSLKQKSRRTLKDSNVSYEQVVQKIDEAREIVSKITSKRPGLSSADIQIEIDPDNTRAIFDWRRKTVVIGPTSGVSTIAHEIGHALEEQEQGQTRRSKSWLAVANEGSEVKVIGSNRTKLKMSSEVYYGGKSLPLHSQYTRKLMDGAATELISQGFSRLIDDPTELVADDAHFRFFMGWLKGK